MLQASEVGEQQQQLAQLLDQTESISIAIEGQQDGAYSTAGKSRKVLMRDALHNLHGEITAMDLQISIIQHELTHKKLQRSQYNG